MGVQQVRRSQFITTYGPGSILEGTFGPRVLLMTDQGLFQPLRLTPHQLEISDRRLQEAVRGRVFSLPSNVQLGLPDDRYVYRTGSFPVWKLCTTDGVLYRDRCPRCNRRERSQAVRFVAACDLGHLDDVDWSYGVHRNRGCLPDYFEWRGGGGTLAETRLRCPECNAERSLGTIYYDSRLPCSGRHPEREAGGSAFRPGCPSNARVTHRGALNLRIPELRSVLIIPPISTSLHRLLNNPSIRSALGAAMTLLGQVPSFDQIGRMLDDLVQRNDISEATRDEVLSHHPDELGQAVSDVLDYRPSTSRLEILQEEFTALRRAAVHGAPPVPPAPGVTHHFEVPRIGVQIVETAGVRLKVVPVTRLTVIMAQVGYRRLDPQNGRLVDISHQADGQVWYPGVELRGEGIFIEAAEDLRLDGSSVADWLELYDGGSQGYEPHLFSDASQPVEMSPLFVWWHSLAHRLITALAVDSGYSAAAIRERVYLHEDRGGILLYSSQAAGDGTYGGLIGLLPEMDRIIRLALQDVEVCSNDPFCADIRIRSGGHLGAACFACVMVSETSCEHRNMWLDRRVLVENRGR
jgi:hypothetical protein